MRVVISGGSGLIGNNVTEALCREDHEVVILSRNPENLGLLPQGARAVQWNGTRPGPWQESLEDVDAVINLAGASIAGSGLLPQRWTPERKQTIVESRVLAGRILTETIRRLEHKPKVFLQASAIGYYGPHGEEYLYESHASGSDFLAKVCQQWEDASSGVKEAGVRRAVLRIGLVLSPDSGLLPLLKLPFRFFLGGPLGSGKQYMSWIHIEDVTRAILFLLKYPQSSGVYNLTAPQPVSNLEFSRTLGRWMHKPSAVPVPAFVLRAMLGEAATLALDGQRVLPRQLLNAGFNFSFDTAEQALADLLT
ncbi:MAG: TIGR01777 family oxidoreductase [Anaerolineales bacterium]|nr:TIGR01777 family oxidoreductase [Anaerolineales bacterium]